MSGRTPGQAAYEAYQLSLYGVLEETFAWDRLNAKIRAAWEAAAKAATAATLAPLAEPKRPATPGTEVQP